jgi:hypothetical protein
VADITANVKQKRGHDFFARSCVLAWCTAGAEEHHQKQRAVFGESKKTSSFYRRTEWGSC